MSALLAGCGSDAAPAQISQASYPLRPLIYTEQPDLSESAAAMREHRLMRELREGSLSRGDHADPPESAPRPATPPAATDADSLGRALYTALVERDEAGWERSFVAPQDYAAMVRVDLEEARRLVDHIQGRSMHVWRRFAPARPSEASDGGLAGLLEFVELELGEGRSVEGPVAKDDELIAQHWGNTLRLKLRGTSVVFELRLNKILRIHHPQKPGAQPYLAVASPVEMSSQLDVFLQAGLHLKPELLESREYPYPLAVGNFWRYERSQLHPPDEEDAAQDHQLNAADQDSPADPDQPGASRSAPTIDPVDQPLAADDELRQPGLAATETLLEVTSVDRYGAMRLVTLRRSYNDEALSSSNQYFLLLPRRIYHCSAHCRRNITDLSRILEYLDAETPLYQFPLSLNSGWGAGGRTLDEEAQKDSANSAAVFTVGSKWRDVRTPAGAYTNTAVITGSGPLGEVSRYYRGRGQTRYFAHGHGEVQRILEERSGSDSVAVVEKLVEARIISR